jgi:hypothetical protein
MGRRRALNSLMRGRATSGPLSSVTRAIRSGLYAVSVAAFVLIAALTIQSGYRVSQSNGNGRLAGAVTVFCIALLVVVGTTFGSLARAVARNRALQLRFPGSTLLTTRRTTDLARKALILDDRQAEGGGVRQSLGYYSSLVVDESGMAFWVGAPEHATRVMFASSERIKELGTSAGADGPVLYVVVENRSEPVRLLIPVSRPGMAGYLLVERAALPELVAKVRAALEPKASGLISDDT